MGRRIKRDVVGCHTQGHDSRRCLCLYTLKNTFIKTKTTYDISLDFRIYC